MGVDTKIGLSPAHALAGRAFCAKPRLPKQCTMCREQAKTWPWKGSAPKCAFKTGRFSSNNWNCGTMNALLELIPDLEGLSSKVSMRWKDDQSYIWLMLDFGAIAITTYKRRGRIEGACFFDSDKITQHTLTLREAERAIGELEKCCRLARTADVLEQAFAALAIPKV